MMTSPLVWTWLEYKSGLRVSREFGREWGLSLPPWGYLGVYSVGSGGVPGQLQPLESPELVFHLSLAPILTCLRPQRYK